ncbi:type III polyketide synthase [Nocardia crassostreae]|uniref:type III polyketide synthase n=1 Tax=Nocardia crassostreae TaxID=53428 RepID=UPI0012FB132E|nr:3-oxoacyl-[acyl-carrier-protein] synthase III C-terminal domain-containing protein [Nocardia crassostreae]
MPPTPPTTVAVIEGIATGSPDQIFEQADAAERVAERFEDPAHQERIRRVFKKTRIDTRRLAVDPLEPEFLEFSGKPATIRERMNLYYRYAAPLAVDVAGRALAAADTAAEEIGLLVFVTSTGFIAPGVDVAIVKELGLPKTVGRVVVNFMGCAAAMNGVRTAVDYVRANPDKKAMVVCIEVSSVNAAFDTDIIHTITHSLFGDGCGAVVIGASQVQQPLAPGKVVLRDTFSYLFDGAEDGIVLGVNDNGITCELSENLQQYIFDGVDPVVSEVLDRNGLQKSDIELWAIHPGGPKIIESSSASLGISADTADLSWDILAQHGNMLSVSLIFVLEQMIQRAETTKPISTGVAFSFAPGVTLEGMIFDIVRR